MKKIILYSLALLSLASCKMGFQQQNQATMTLSDQMATRKTVVLYQNLKRISGVGILFGHQDALAYGVNWKYENGRSDVKEVTGDYPAVYGWDLGGLERKAENNLDGIPFDKMRQYIKEAHKRGGINTISWHIDNPFNGKSAWDTTPNSLQSALPGGNCHEKYKFWLDEGVKFFLSLKDEDGELIPILYRPYHELTGAWFWWCKNNASPKEFKALWKFTVDYFKAKGVHNLIYVYNTSTVDNREEYLEYYAGEDYADILSFDNYQMADPLTDNSFVEKSLKLFGIIDQIAQKQNKLIAFGETGYETIPYGKWWTETLMNAMGDYNISYVLLWRNHGWKESEKKMHYYVPFKGQPSEKDFIEFYKLDRTLFEKDARREKLFSNLK